MIRVFPWGPWKPHASCGYVPIWSQFLVLDLQISKGSWLVLVIRDTEISFWIGTDQIQINFNRIFQIGYFHISNKLPNRIPHPDGTTIPLPRKKKQSGRRLGKISILSVTWFGWMRAVYGKLMSGKSRSVQQMFAYLWDITDAVCVIQYTFKIYLYITIYIYVYMILYDYMYRIYYCFNLL